MDGRKEGSEWGKEGGSGGRRVVLKGGGRTDLNITKVEIIQFIFSNKFWFLLLKFNRILINTQRCSKSTSCTKIK